MKLNHYLLSAVFLSVILLTGVMMLGFPIQDVFAANEKQKVEDKDKKPLKQTTQSKIESLKGLKANEKRVIVFYKNDVKSEDLTELTKKGASVKSDFDKMRAVVIHMDAAKLKDLQLDPNIERIVEDRIVHATLDTSIPQIGANSVYSLGITGQGVKTCIVDTGVDDTHPALNPLVAEINFVTLDIFGNPTGNATDDNGHGTHVAGIIASNDATFRGVAPGSSLMAAKVLDNTGSGWSSDVADGIDWCVANGADVINLSLGGGLFPGDCDSNLEAMAVNDAVAVGVVVAVASGNDGTIDAVSSPACASGAIAVGAIDDFDGRTDFSNEGPQLDVVAPGAPVTSLNAPINGGEFATFFGTSMATPHVAGLAALILDANPTLTQTQVRSAIENNALDLGVAGFDTIYGNGRIQASNSVNSVLPILLPAISLSDVSVPEGNLGQSTHYMNVTLSYVPLLQGVIVNYTTSDGTATVLDNDYFPTSGQVIFSLGETSKLIPFPVPGDITPEPDETFDIILSNPVDGTILDGTGVVTILNDDAPLPAISLSDVSVPEGNLGQSTHYMNVTLSYVPLLQGVIVNYTTSDGTATVLDNDYFPTSGQVIFSLGETSKLIPFPVPGDITPEPDETFDIILSNPVDGTILDGTGVVTILNDDAPLPAISLSDVSVPEGNLGQSTHYMNVTLSYVPLLQGVIVNYTTSDGTATVLDNDYFPTSGQVIFSLGETSKLIPFPVPGDITPEPDETFDIILSNPVDGTILDGTGVVTILNDDAPLPAISLSDVSVPEGNLGQSTHYMNVTLSYVPLLQGVIVNYTTSDGTATVLDNDYFPTSGQVIFSLGETSKLIPFPVPGDITPEPDETFDIILSNPVDGTILDGTGVVTILNDDAPLPAISLSDVSVPEGNLGQSTHYMNVTLSYVPLLQGVIVNYTTSDGTATVLDNDYFPTSGQVIFSLGETSKLIPFPVPGDITPEPDETFDIILSNPVDGTILDGTGVVTILNDDPPTISINDVSVTEGDAGTTSSQLTVSLSGLSTSTVTVGFFTFDGTATGDIDYTVTSGTVTFLPGETIQTISVTILGDTTIEADETFNVALTNPVNASILDDTGVGTILDNDSAPLNLSRAFLSINSGGSGTILSVFGSGFTSGSTVTIHFDGGSPIASTDVIDGKFTTPITIPAATPGLHAITASDGINDFTNQFMIIAPRVTPTETILFLNPINSGSPDSIVSLHGKGFAGNAGATITISVDGVQVTTTPVGIVGSFKNISITMPSTPGTHTISASDGANTASSTFYVTTPRLVLSSDTGASGDMVTISASGFIPNSTIHISFDGGLLLDVTSTSSGRISNTMINPTGTSGLHTISISDDTSTVNSPYTIIP